MVEGIADPWAEADHLVGGALALELLGVSRDEIWAASVGLDYQDERQVLVFGFCNVEILSADGEVLLDAGHREVRGIRHLEDTGVEVCVTGASSATALRPQRWLHRVSNQDARYLEDLWLKLSPVTHSGIGLNPLHWREDEYAYFVGRVVTEAAKCDVSLAELVIAGRTLRGESSARVNEVHGESGGPLAKMLKALGNYSPAIAEIAERYEAWYDWRNFAVHGVRAKDSSGFVTERVIKVPKSRRSKAQAAVAEVKEQDFQRLALAWHAFYMLNHDAWATRIRIPPAGDSDQLLWELPLSNSVNPDERLPPDA